MGYDSRCYDLAVLFLSDNPEKDTEANRDELAQHIQTEIEDWIEYILKPTTSTLSRPEQGSELPRSSAGTEQAEALLDLAHRIERCNPTHMVGAHTRPFLYRQDVEAIVSALRHSAGATNALTSIEPQGGRK